MGVCEMVGLPETVRIAQWHEVLTRVRLRNAGVGNVLYPQCEFVFT